MATYCWKCPECGARFETAALGDYGCLNCGDGELVRDWKAEGAAFTTVPGAHKDTYRDR